MATTLFSRTYFRNLLKSGLIIPSQNLRINRICMINSNFMPEIKNEVFYYSTRHISFTNVLYLPDSVPCWKCGITVDLNKVLFCDSCEVVQRPVGDANYFEILGVRKSFEVDNKELTNKFRLLQMQLHPDRFTHKSEDEKQISANYSSLLNQAYKTLQSPLERGVYLLQLEGHHLLEEEISLEPEFLNEIMEVNEEIDEIKDQQDIQRISEKNQLKMDDLFRRAAKYFQKCDWKSARDCMNRLSYYSNIQKKLKTLEQD